VNSLSLPLVQKIPVRSDFIIEFTPDRMTNKGLEYNPDALSFVEALKKQLGLRFESRRAPVRSMIIDQIEQPAPN
jgi:uncharacterized protein (TIGR03435 family)